MNKLTIAILSYNRGKYLEEMVRSVLAQSRSDFDVVIWDNASEKGTLAFLDKIHDPRLRVVVHSKNIGAAENANCAIQACNTEYLLLTHDDDRLKPSMVESYLNAVGSDADLTLVCCDADQIDSEGSVLLTGFTQRRFPQLLNHKTSQGGLAREYVDGLNYIICPTVMLKVQAVRDNGIKFRNEAGPAMDSYFWSELSYIPGSFLYLSQSLYEYRVHRQQDSQVQASVLITKLRRPYFEFLKTKDPELARRWWAQSLPQVLNEWMDANQPFRDRPGRTFLYRGTRLWMVPDLSPLQKVIFFFHLAGGYILHLMKGMKRKILG